MIVPARQEVVGILLQPFRRRLLGANLITTQHVHWAEQIFSLPLPSRTALKHLKPYVSKFHIAGSGDGAYH